MPYRYIRTADAVSEPITLAEAKAQLRVDFDDDDAYITALITTARQYCEQVTGRQFITATWTLTLDDFPVGRNICIEKGNLIGVTSITYNDADDAQQTLSASSYQVNTGVQPGYVSLNDGETWPTTSDNPSSVTVTFTAGYGADSSAVPFTIKQAIKILVSHWYEVREPVIVGTSVTNVPMSVDSLLAVETQQWL